MELIYPMAMSFHRVTLRALADWEVEGRENVPPMGPLIVVANHQGSFDPPLIGASIPRRTWFLAKDDIFSGPPVSWLLRKYGAFPLSRSGPDIRAYRWALDKLDRDEVVVLFPEGTRNRGGMREAQSGVVRLALKAQVPLLPVGITGTENMGTWLRVFNPTGRFRVRIGTAFSLPTLDGKLSTDVMKSLTDMVMHRVAALLPPAYQGVYGSKT